MKATADSLNQASTVWGITIDRRSTEGEMNASDRDPTGCHPMQAR